MAIYSAVPPPPELGGPTPPTNSEATQEQSQQGQYQQSPPQVSNAQSSTSSAIDIEAWTVSALESLSVSPGAARGTGGTPLSIPLDGRDQQHQSGGTKPSVNFNDARARSGTVTPPPRPLSRRDSLRRREALLKGKEGSRQRRRWENDRLIDVPNAQPPEPKDWAPCPTHPVVHVPYQVAGAWDTRVRAEAEARRAVAAKRKEIQTRTLGDGNVAGRVPRELCVRAKKIPAVKGWVRGVEEVVRRFLVDGGVAAASPTLGGDGESSGTEEGEDEDDEIVFVGRNGSMRDGRKRTGTGMGAKVNYHRVTVVEQGRGGASGGTGLMFDDDMAGGRGAGADEASGFRRWITHSISDYYGLESKSVVVGEPKRKVVYVEMKEAKLSHDSVALGGEIPVLVAPARLPRPLWELC